MPYPSWQPGMRITSGRLTSMQPVIMRKTSDTSRASTTTPTADPELQFEAEANAVYRWFGWLKYFADPAADMIVDFTVPSGALGEWSGWAAGSGTTTSTTTGYSIRTETNDVDQSRNMYGPSDATVTALLHGTLRMSSVPGVWSLDWAQGTSSATATVIYTDSWIEMVRIA